MRYVLVMGALVFLVGCSARQSPGDLYDIFGPPDEVIHGGTTNTGTIIPATSTTYVWDCVYTDQGWQYIAVTYSNWMGSESVTGTRRLPCDKEILASD